MSYLTAYRQGASRYGNAGNKLSNLPAPYKPKTSPPIPSANDNLPRFANDNIRRAKQLSRLTPAGRRLLRLHPLIRTADNAFELWRLINSKNTQGGVLNMGAFTQSGLCSSLSPTHATYSVGFCVGPESTICPGIGQVVSNARGVGEPAGIGCQMRLYFYPASNSSPGNPRYDILSYWWKPGGGLNPGFVPLRQRFNYPARLPVLDPNSLPIGMPMQLPVPLPWDLVPHLVNDPIGSQRDNGDVRPRFVPRRPPPDRTKEVKLRALTNFVGVVQRAFHGVTEGLDYLDAFHDALPKEFQAKGGFVKGLGFRNATPQAKAAAIWSNFDKLDWNKVVLNLIKNEIGDRILGRANAGANRALNNAPGGRINRGFAF